MANHPTKEECYRLLEEYHVPKNIIEHSEQVARVAVFLGKKLNENGVEVDIGLLEASGLLHDIARTVEFVDSDSYYIQPTEEDICLWRMLKKRYLDKKHNLVGYEIFKDEYPEMALIIKRHLYGIVITKDKPETWEEKIFNYADKRVAHSDIVTLKFRIEEGNERNKKEKEHTDLNEKDVNKINKEHQIIEKEIFDIIGLDSDKLLDYLNNEEK